jgi:hypothetical protein
MTSDGPTAPTGLELARLWSEAPALLPHGAGCACAGHVGLHLDPTTVEADLLDWLAGRYAANGDHELAAVVAARRGERRGTFASWLIALDTAALSEMARRRLMADLDVTISSLARARG